MRDGQRGAIAAATAILACVALLAFMQSHDANSALVKESEDTDVQAETLENQVDDIGSWKTLADQAVEVSKSAQDLKSKENNEMKADQQKAKVKAEAGLLNKSNKHAVHKTLREQAAKETSSAVKKAFDGITKGLSKAAQEAAETAAYKAAKRKEQQAKQTKVVAEHAMKEEQQVQTTLGQILRSKRQLERIKKQEQRDTKAHHKKEKDTAQALRVRVRQTTREFKAISHTLKVNRQDADTVKTTQKLLTEKTKAAALLQSKVDEVERKLEELQKSNTRDGDEFSRKQRSFSRKKRNMIRKITMMQDKMKIAIKTTAIRKATPHQDAQVLLNSLIQREHENDLKIAKLSMQLNNHQKHVHKSKQQEAKLILTTNKQGNALKLAHVAVSTMSTAVETLTKVVNNKDTTTLIKTGKSFGVDYTKRLLAETMKAVKEQVSDSEGLEVRHVETNMPQRGDPVAVRKSLAAVVKVVKQDAKKAK